MSLQTVEGGNVLLVPLEIRLDDLDRLEDILRRLRDAGGQPGISEPGASIKDESQDQKSKRVVDDFNKALGMTQQAAGTMKSMASNPLGFMMGLMTNPYVMAAIAAAMTGKMVLDILMLQGNVLDKHFKRIIDRENNKGLRRNERQQIRTGLGRQVIITGASGSTSPEYAINTFRSVRDGTISQADSFEIRKGYRF